MKTRWPLQDPFYRTVVILSLLLSAAWGLALPLFESPDEQNHYRYMLFLKDHGRLPRQLPLPAEVSGEGHQPPLYYAVGALFLKAAFPHAGFDGLDVQPTVFDQQPAYFRHTPAERWWQDRQTAPVHLLRLLQLIVFVLPGLVALALILHGLLPHGWGRITFAALALNPAFIALGGALNNDHGAFALGTLAFACLLPCLQGRALSTGAWIALGVLLSAAGLAKPTALGLFLVPAVLLLLRPKELGRPGPWLAGLAALAILGWWFLRNWALYDDATAFNAVGADCPQCLNPKPLLNLHWWAWWAQRSFESFWGVFGWMTWKAPGWFHAGMALLCAVALGGWFRKEGALDREARFLAWAGLAGVTTVILRHDLALDPPAGRYFFAALAPIGLILGHGASAWRKASPVTAWVVGSAVALLDLWLIVAKLIPLYRP